MTWTRRLSHAYRNRVPRLSRSNRNPSDHHEPETHKRYGTWMARPAIGWLIERAALVAFIAADLRRRLGAGEGNRTPTVSLGS